MRVIAGQYRGRTLKTPPDARTRPTSDRLRETLFNILTPHITDETRFLDLCAGTGAVGIEALSRGAAYATFVDRSRRSCGLIETNLDLLDVSEDQTEVILAEADDFLRRNKTREGIAWDIVFFDPPYNNDYQPILQTFGEAEAKLLLPDAIFIAEHHHKTVLPDLSGELRRWRIVKQGDSCLSLYERD